MNALLLLLSLWLPQSAVPPKPVPFTAPLTAAETKDKQAVIEVIRARASRVHR